MVAVDAVTAELDGADVDAITADVLPLSVLPTAVPSGLLALALNL
jgi:hypothetical protein